MDNPASFFECSHEGGIKGDTEAPRTAHSPGLLYNLYSKVLVKVWVKNKQFHHCVKTCRLLVAAGNRPSFQEEQEPNEISLFSLSQIPYASGSLEQSSKLRMRPLLRGLTVAFIEIHWAIVPILQCPTPHLIPGDGHAVGCLSSNRLKGRTSLLTLPWISSLLLRSGKSINLSCKP